MVNVCTLDFNENDQVDPETGQDREGYRFLAVLFKNCWIEQKWEYGRIHLDDQGIIHFSISKDSQTWILIPMSNPQHPRYVLPQSDLVAIIGPGSTDGRTVIHGDPPTDEQSSLDHLNFGP